jgi:hypothetical protein
MRNVRSRVPEVICAIERRPKEARKCTLVLPSQVFHQQWVDESRIQLHPFSRTDSPAPTASLKFPSVRVAINLVLQNLSLSGRFPKSVAAAM